MATDIESKIAKLLAMAEGTTNQHEAETFMAKAEELMLAHGVERAQLEAKQVGATKKTTPIVTKRIYIKDGHGYGDALRTIGHEVGPSFNVKTFQSNYGTEKCLVLVGHEDDVQDATTLWTSLSTQAIPAAKAWWKETGKHEHLQAQWGYKPSDNDAYLARREFIYGFARGAGSRLRETRNRVVHEAGSGAELVLVDRKQAVESWIADNMKVGVARGGNRRSGGMGASAAGREAGRNAVGNRSIGR